MCGIFGTNILNLEAAKKAAKTFAYRGPDYTGVRHSGGCILVHNRLSVIDLDSRSHQPMIDKEGKTAIVFNGEIYNYKELRKGLFQNYDFGTESDTEVLLAMYQQYGKGALSKFSGMFAFGVLDESRGKIFLARDHAGIKPLYYHLGSQGEFIFASEISGIVSMLRSSSVEPEIDQESVALLFSLGYIPAPRTLFKSISRLSKASFLEFDLKSKKISDEGTYIPFTGTSSDVETSLDESIDRHLIADVPVGLFFSGGVDSSLIAALLQKHGVNLETFSISLDQKSEDQRCFRGIAQYLKLIAHENVFSLQEFESVYEEIMSRLNEPCADNSIFPTYYVSKMASEKVKVVLSGEGGDELFMGYPRMKNLSRMKKGQKGESSFLDMLLFVTPDFKGKNKLFEKLFVYVGDAPSYYLMTMSPSKNLMPYASWKKAKSLIASASSDPLLYDRELYLENMLLRKTDIVTSLVSLEGRVPLLDPMVWQHAESLGEEKLLEGGELKAVPKHILAKYVPSEFVYRKKSGFGMNLESLFHESKFLRNDLERAVVELPRYGIDTLIQIDSLDRQIKRYPNFCFALVVLYRSLQNVLHSDTV